MLSKKSKMLLVVLLTMLVGGLGLGVWWITRTHGRFPTRQAELVRPESGKDAPVPGAMTPKEKKEKQAAESARTAGSPAARATPAEQAAQSPAVPHAIPVSGNLGKLTRLRAHLHELDAQVAVAEKEAKLSKLEADPIVVAPPEQTASALQLPALMPAERKNTAADRPGEPRVVSVQGVNGELSATIRTRSGSLVTVRQGGRYAGGIAEIGRSRVAIRTGRNTTLLPFE